MRRMIQDYPLWDIIYANYQATKGNISLKEVIKSRNPLYKRIALPKNCEQTKKSIQSDILRFIKRCHFLSEEIKEYIKFGKNSFVL